MGLLCRVAPPTQASLGVLLGPLELREPSHRCEPQADILGPVQVVAVAVVARLGAGRSSIRGEPVITARAVQRPG